MHHVMGIQNGIESWQRYRCSSNANTTYRLDIIMLFKDLERLDDAMSQSLIRVEVPNARAVQEERVEL